MTEEEYMNYFLGASITEANTSLNWVLNVLEKML